MNRVLIFGAGLLGAQIARACAALGHASAVCARSPATNLLDVESFPIDARDQESVYRVIEEFEPSHTVLVHGPSDVSWCEQNPDEAMSAHAGITTNVLAAGRGTHVCFISSDAVFDGLRSDPDETTEPVNAANAYGRAKLTAERMIIESGVQALVLRVSAVYGWESPGRVWSNFFQSTYDNLSRGESIEAPNDVFNTPVLLSDFVWVTQNAIQNRAEGILHVGGPDVVSRFEWAASIAREFRFDLSQIASVSASGTRYSSRPKFSCLRSGRLDNTLLTGVRDGAAQLKSAVRVARLFSVQNENPAR